LEPERLRLQSSFTLVAAAMAGIIIIAAGTIIIATVGNSDDGRLTELEREG